MSCSDTVQLAARSLLAGLAANSKRWFTTSFLEEGAGKRCSGCGLAAGFQTSTIHVVSSKLELNTVSGAHRQFFNQIQTQLEKFHTNTCYYNNSNKTIITITSVIIIEEEEEEKEEEEGGGGGGEGRRRRRRRRRRRKKKKKKKKEEEEE